MHALADGSPWYGKSVKDALESVDHHLSTKRINNQHNIAELVYHINQWKKFAFEKIAGDIDIEIKLNSDKDWRKIDSLTAAEWAHLVSYYFEITENLIGAVQSIKKDWLDQKVPHRKYNYSDLISGIIEHDIYHLGQIIIIAKILNA